MVAKVNPYAVNRKSKVLVGLGAALAWYCWCITPLWINPRALWPPDANPTALSLGWSGWLDLERNYVRAPRGSWPTVPPLVTSSPYSIGLNVNALPLMLSLGVAGVSGILLLLSCRWLIRWTTLANVCRRCGYDLTGLTSGICPECGFRVREGARGRPKPRVGRLISSIAIAVGLLALVRSAVVTDRSIELIVWFVLDRAVSVPLLGLLLLFTICVAAVLWRSWRGT